MHVGFLSYALDRAQGGIARYSRELLGALHQNRVALTELRAGHSKSPTAKSLPGAGILPGLLTLGQAGIAWNARRCHLDVVHDPTGSAPLLLAGARRVSTIHDVIPFVYPGVSTTLDRLIYQVWLPIAVRQLDAIITVSEWSKADIVRHLPVPPDRVVVIRSAANERFRPLSLAEVQPVLAAHDISSPYILYVGSLEPRKNLPRLLAAYRRLLDWSDRWNLVVVGAPRWNTSGIASQLRDLNLKDQVRFTGFVPDDDLPALYRGADLFVFPSLYEGFGLPVVEAMACGTPVVTSKTSSLPEVADGAALLVDPLEPSQIAAGMQRVLDDRTLADGLRARGLLNAQRFTWERVAREVCEVYQRVLDSRPVGR